MVQVGEHQDRLSRDLIVSITGDAPNPPERSPELGAADLALSQGLDWTICRGLCQPQLFHDSVKLASKEEGCIQSACWVRSLVHADSQKGTQGRALDTLGQSCAVVCQSG